MWTKNIQLGIKAFIAADLPKPWRLIVAGYVDAKSQVYLQDLKDLVPEGVGVEFVEKPSQTQLKKLYQQTAFCLFTPMNEDWGIVPLESMTHAKAVIANASGGPLESIVDQKTGYLCHVDDLEGWANAIRKLALDPELQVELGRQAHEHVRQFTWEQFVKRIDTAVEGWVEGSSIRGRRQTDEKRKLRKKTT